MVDFWRCLGIGAFIGVFVGMVVAINLLEWLSGDKKRYKKRHERKSRK